ncbi:MAG: PD-(D/E)XK nuclease family protein, partial [Promethearchaeota archaeon]
MKEENLNIFINEIKGNFNKLEYKSYEEKSVINSYSLSEVVAYRLCRRQYGLLIHRRFITPSLGEFFFGQLIHRVLNKAFKYYCEKNKKPLGEYIEKWAKEISKTLKLHGTRPLSYSLEQRAINLIKTFNEKLGDLIFPLVVETEFKLKMFDEYKVDNKNKEEEKSKTFILTGIVDLIK